MKKRLVKQRDTSIMTPETIGRKGTSFQTPSMKANVPYIIICAWGEMDLDVHSSFLRLRKAESISFFRFSKSNPSCSSCAIIAAELLVDTLRDFKGANGGGRAELRPRSASSIAKKAP